MMCLQGPPQGLQLLADIIGDALRHAVVDFDGGWNVDQVGAPAPVTCTGVRAGASHRLFPVQLYAVPTALMSFWTFTPLSDVHVSSSLDAVKSWLLLPFHLVGKSCAVNVLLYRTTWGAF